MLTAREIELHVRNKGAERGIVHVATVLAEQQKSLHESIMELAQLLARVTDTMMVDTAVRAKMVNEIRTLQRNRTVDVEAEGADDPQGLLR